MKRIFMVSFQALIIASMLLIALYGCDTSTTGERATGQKYTITRMPQSPDIDGNLNDSCWKEVDTWTLVKAADGKQTSISTTVRVGYDDTFIYVGFECQDPDAVSTVTQHDGPVFGGEHVALYIDANSDRSTYAVIEVAPNGVMRDAYVLNYNNGEKRIFLSDWKCDGIRSSVTVYGGNADAGTVDRFWTVELAIPHDAFVTAPHIPPQSGDEWLINIYRAELTDNRKYTALVPTGDEGFHHPQSFAHFTFTE